MKEIITHQGSYDGNNEAADSYLELLTNDLIQARMTLSTVLDYQKYLFIFDGLSITLNELFITSLNYIKRFRRPLGPRKLLNNLELLEQCLALISLTSDGSLEKARKYYQLTSIPLNDLLDKHLQGKVYTMMQCIALVRLFYLETENDPAKEKEFQNQLIRLKYMFEIQSK